MTNSRFEIGQLRPLLTSAAALLLGAWVSGWGLGSAQEPGTVAPRTTSSDSGKKSPSDAASEDIKLTGITGKIVWTSDILERKFGVKTDPDAVHGQVALETPAGALFQIIKDFRGRGFWKDERLHNRELELRVKQFPGTSLVQVIRVFSLKEDRKFELDYWCDICAIPMYELKECECCQGPIRIRERFIGKRNDPLPDREPSE